MCVQPHQHTPPSRSGWAACGRPSTTTGGRGGKRTVSDQPLHASTWQCVHNSLHNLSAQVAIPCKRPTHAQRTPCCHGNVTCAPHAHHQVAPPTPDCVCFDSCVDELQHTITRTHTHTCACNACTKHHQPTTQVAYSQCRHPAAVRSGVEHAPKHGHPPVSSCTLRASIVTTPCNVVHENKH